VHRHGDLSGFASSTVSWYWLPVTRSSMVDLHRLHVEARFPDPRDLRLQAPQ